MERGQGNLFDEVPAPSAAEHLTTLLASENFHLERIISTGQSTPEGQWLTQETGEWVVLLSGAAGLRFEQDAQEIVMRPGDYVYIPAGCRHRVAWTSPDEKSVWLALHDKSHVSGSESHEQGYES